MRCAVSFLTVVGLTIGVGVVALYIISITDDEGECPDNLRCSIDGKCIKQKEFCNGVHDCSDGSDELAVRCNDLTTIHELFEIMSNCTVSKDKNKGVLSGSLGEHSNNNDTEDEQQQQQPLIEEPELQKIPPGCEFFNPARNESARGIKCNNSTALSWTNIPWNQFDHNAVAITIYSGVLNTTQLVAQEENSVVRFNRLNKLFLGDNTIESVEAGAFCHMESVCWLVLERNSIRNLNSSAFCSMPQLKVLVMSENRLHLSGFQFKGMPILKMLRLEYNEIASISEDMFSLLPNLKMLNISHNKIDLIHEHAFRNNTKLVELDLTGNNLHHLANGVFEGQAGLVKLYISDNPLKLLQSELFKPLANLESLNIEDYELTRIDVNLFRHTPLLDIVFFKKFSYCRFVPKARRCYPYSDGLSSTHNLLIGQSRITVWLIGLLTLLGNMSVLANRWMRNRGRTGINNIFLSNLACADFLMGVYLLILACKDVEFRGKYNVKAYEWATSWLCSVIGIIAMISSEASLLILTILSLERYLVVAGGVFTQRQSLNRNLARASMTIIWGFACILAIAPAIQWQGNHAFYGSSGLCFPLHLDDRHAVGWQYTAFVFIGVNFCCLLLITVWYSMLFYTVRKTQNRTPLQVKNSELELASRFFLMVITDVLCWAPIIALKTAVLFGYELPKEIISWAVIYVLPINSAVNPILYTFSTNEVRSALISQFLSVLRNLGVGITQLFSSSRAGSVELESAVNACTCPVQPATGPEDTEVTHSSVCPMTPKQNNVSSKCPHSNSPSGICRINNQFGSKSNGASICNPNCLYGKLIGDKE